MTGPTSHPPHLAVAARHRRRPLSGWPRLVAASCAVVLALGVTACSSDDDTPSTGAGSATTADGAGGGEGSVIRVPEDHETIQAALDAAAPGDLVLVGKGVYEEAVDVTTADVTIRGVDRNEVILDGGFELENGIRVLDTDGVVVENLTVRNYVSNGVFWTGSDRYRGSYLTVYRNGGYCSIRLLVPAGWHPVIPLVWSTRRRAAAWKKPSSYSGLVRWPADWSGDPENRCTLLQAAIPQFVFCLSTESVWCHTHQRKPAGLRNR